MMDLEICYFWNMGWWAFCPCVGLEIVLLINGCNIDTNIQIIGSMGIGSLGYHVCFIWCYLNRYSSQVLSFLCFLEGMVDSIPFWCYYEFCLLLGTVHMRKPFSNVRYLSSIWVSIFALPRQERGTLKIDFSSQRRSWAFAFHLKSHDRRSNIIFILGSDPDYCVKVRG